jgi:hypothetical protein
MNTPEIIEELKKAGRFVEAHRIYNFRCHREATDGSHTVNVEITDMGDSNPNARYSVIANQDSGKIASGNPGSSIYAALAMVHWFNLD